MLACGKVGLGLCLRGTRGHSSSRRAVAYVPAPMFTPRRLLATVGLAGCVLAVCSTRGVASVTATGPTCTPATLDGTAQLDGAVTVSPMPGAARRVAADADQLPRGPRAGAERRSASSARSAAPTPARSRPTRRATAAASCRAAPFRRGRARDSSPRTWRYAAGDEPLQLRLHRRAAATPVSSTHEQLHRLGSGRSAALPLAPGPRSPRSSLVHRTSPRQSPGDTFIAPYDVPASGRVR